MAALDGEHWASAHWLGFAGLLLPLAALIGSSNETVSRYVLGQDGRRC